MAGRYVVLDEADRMLEVGFAESVEEILSVSFSKGKTIRRIVLFLLVAENNVGSSYNLGPTG